MKAGTGAGDGGQYIVPLLYEPLEHGTYAGVTALSFPPSALSTLEGSRSGARSAKVRGLAARDGRGQE